MRLTLLFSLLFLSPLLCFNLRSLQDTPSKPAKPGPPPNFPSFKVDQEYIDKLEEQAQKRPFVDDYLCGGYNALSICSVCYDGFLVRETSRCQEVQDKVPNCRSYFPNRQCSVCDPGFFFDNETKVCVENTIEGCKFQFGDRCTVSFPHSDLYSSHNINVESSKCQFCIYINANRSKQAAIINLVIGLEIYLQTALFLTLRTALLGF